MPEDKDTAVAKSISKTDPSAPKRRHRVSLAEVKALGLNSDSLTEAAAQFSGPGELETLITKRSKVKAAWERGRMLRTIRALAATTCPRPFGVRSAGMLSRVMFSMQSGIAWRRWRSATR